MRKAVFLFHRVAGLAIAILLILLGSTGSILVWEEEIDTFLNPKLLENTTDGVPLAPPVLMSRAASSFAGSLDFLVYPRDSHRSAIIYVGAVQGSGQQATQIFVDRHTGEILGGRNTVSPDLFSTLSFMPWILRFHYSLNAGRTGTLLLGVVAFVWFLDCLVAWFLTLPRQLSWRGWRPAWLINSSRFAYDTHRASSLWLTPVFVVLAFTGIYFNLYNEVFLPSVETVSTITPQPFQQQATGAPIEDPDISYTKALAKAHGELERRGVDVHALDYLSWNPNLGYYVTAFYTERDLSRDSPSAHVYVNHDGTLRQVRLIGGGTAGDTLVDWQFPLHSGQAFGLPGRIIVCLSGIALAIVSATGVLIWWRKTKVRRRPRKSYEAGGSASSS